MQSSIFEILVSAAVGAAFALGAVAAGYCWHLRQIEKQEAFDQMDEQVRDDMLEYELLKSQMAHLLKDEALALKNHGAVRPIRKQIRTLENSMAWVEARLSAAGHLNEGVA